MTTNLLYAFPDIPFNASSHTLTGKGAGTGFDLESVVAGSRGQRFEFDDTNSTPSHLFDLGSGYASLDSTAEYLIISYANLSINQGSTAVVLEARTGTGGGFTSIVNDAWVTGDLVDPNARDYIITFNETSQYRQWQVSLNGTSSTQTFPHAQIYFGTFFDFDRDPFYSRRAVSEYWQDKGIYEKVKFELFYSGISTTKREEFERKIGQYKDAHPIFLYSQTYEAVTLGTQLLNCKISDYTFRSNASRQNDLTLIVEELY